MRTLIYKRTHSGDPDPESGVFGNHDCMGTVRGRLFDAVIGIGGIGSEPKRWRIAGKLTWVGIGPHKIYEPDHPHSPRVAFDHFWYLGERGPLLEIVYPALANHMYGTNRRQVMHSSSSLIPDDLDRDIKKILALAKAARSSGQLSKRKSRSGAYSCRGDKSFPIRSICRGESRCSRSAKLRSTSPSCRRPTSKRLNGRRQPKG
jgi:hypothetical protein